jgi:hypothetical protein
VALVHVWAAWLVGSRSLRDEIWPLYPTLTPPPAAAPPPSPPLLTHPPLPLGQVALVSNRGFVASVPQSLHLQNTALGLLEAKLQGLVDRLGAASSPVTQGMSGFLQHSVVQVEASLHEHLIFLQVRHWGIGWGVACGVWPRGWWGMHVRAPVLGRTAHGMWSATHSLLSVAFG